MMLDCNLLQGTHRDIRTVHNNMHQVRNITSASSDIKFLFKNLRKINGKKCVGVQQIKSMITARNYRPRIRRRLNRFN